MSYDQWGNVVETETETETATYDDQGNVIETTEQDTDVQYDEVRTSPGFPCYSRSPFGLEDIPRE